MLRSAVQRVSQGIKRFRKQFTPRGLILMYHRVDEQGIDPWSLCVTPEHFAAHLDVLRRHLHPISLQNLAVAHGKAEIPDGAVAITFDDGYANNLFNAKPLLAEKDIPASVFVTTGYVGQAREFWWDELEQVILQPEHLPSQLSLLIQGQEKTWEVGEAIDYSTAAYQHDRGLHVLSDRASPRLKFYYAVWQALQGLDETERSQHLTEIYNWATVQPVARSSHRPMTAAELCHLEAGGVVEIGAHTVHHPLLSAQTPSVQQAEISESKASLEAILGHPVQSFAYPFGVYSQETIGLVQQTGFSCACTTVAESVWQGDHSLQLPRFEVRNWSGDEFEHRLSRWLQT